MCPLLLRVFTKLGSHHHLEDFGKRGQESKDEVQMYTWMDATLRCAGKKRTDVWVGEGEGPKCGSWG